MSQPDQANDNTALGLEVIVAQRVDDPGIWTVEAIAFGSEGEVYQALFIGPDAERRARDYARFAYGDGPSSQT